MDGVVYVEPAALAALGTPQRVYLIVAMARYLTHCQSRGASREHLANIKRSLDRFADLRRLTNAHLDEVTNLDLTEYVALRRQQTFRGATTGPVTINNELAALNSFFLWCGPKTPGGRGRSNMAWIEWPPFHDRLPMDEPVPAFVTPEQLAKFIAAAETATTPRLPDLSPRDFWTIVLVLGLVTGLRRRALLEVPRPDDFTLLERHELPIHGRHMKKRRAITLPLPEEVVQLIQRLPSKPGERLLPWRWPDGRPMTFAHFSDTMKNLQRKAGIADDQRVRLKGLRSTAATTVLEEHGETNAKRRLAHAASTTTLLKHYAATRVSAGDIAASETLAGLVLPLLGRRPDLYVFSGDDATG